MDCLLKELRNQGLGCHVAGIWMGAAGYADDIVLLAPSRVTMARMLSVCELYAEKHNLLFSTDENPKKSKSKCIFINGKVGMDLPRQLPEPLQLYGKNLPWVVTATHLGHELHQSGTMDQDCRVKRALFIDSSIEIRETFSFALPHQVLKAVHLNSLHCYGAMLWKFDSPRSVPVRQELYARYTKFLKQMTKSPSYEVKVLARIATSDFQSTTGTNILIIQREIGLDPTSVSARQIRQLDLKRPVPERDTWRLETIEKMLKRGENWKPP